MSKSIIKTNINIDVNTGALILIDMLFAQKLINEKTYNNIQEKYITNKKRGGLQDRRK